MGKLINWLKNIRLFRYIVFYKGQTYTGHSFVCSRIPILSFARIEEIESVIQQEDMAGPTVITGWKLVLWGKRKAIDPASQYEPFQHQQDSGEPFTLDTPIG